MSNFLPAKRSIDIVSKHPFFRDVLIGYRVRILVRTSHDRPSRISLWTGPCAAKPRESSGANRFRAAGILLPMRTAFAILCLTLLLVGCATRPPDPILDAPTTDLSLGEVAASVSAYVGQRVRWGGKIAGVENRVKETWLDIVARPLDSNGRPHANDQSLGRFLARVDGFLDPAVYAKGRALTVAGTIEGTLTRAIGDYPYTYVIVKADATRLWEPMERPLYYRDPFYDPFYDPFWPRFYPWYPFFPRW